MVMFHTRPSREFPFRDVPDIVGKSESSHMLGFLFRDGFLGLCVEGEPQGVVLLLLDFNGPYSQVMSLSLSLRLVRNCTF